MSRALAGPGRSTSATNTAEDVERYPFDPCAEMDHLRGLERLRAIEDRRLAADLYELHWHVDMSTLRDLERGLRHLGARAT